ncbi:conserved membrane hypothetical protein [uncultured Eubacteriales bacterium]|uniref:DUF554 domain-containing protein n=1 Tax=uncultured Eubacteriales bacterium TaxID=172733 RepID=A0A212JSA9_9FIRM|nr:conserved membrane hypothetical protein [uncultured Eubacteriales bacterium]
MPIGLMVDCTGVLLGGLAGAALGPRLSPRVSRNLTVVLGFSSMAIGVNSIVKASAMMPVVIAVIFGSLIGELLDLETRIMAVSRKIVRRLPHREGALDMERFITVVVLFCASGFGIYGALMEGMSGNASILLFKAVLDSCTAAVFAVTLGVAVALVAFPMVAVLGSLFLAAGLLAPHVTPSMLQDFMACGGVLTLAAGLRVSGIKSAPIANMIPALALALPASAAWTALMG